MALEYHANRGHEGITDPFILSMEGAPCPYYGISNNDGWGFKTDFDRIGSPFGHLLTIGGLANLHFQHSRVPCLVSDIGLHEWSNGTRFVGIKKDSIITTIHPGPDVHQLLHERWKNLMVSTFEPITHPLYALVKMGRNTWFTQKRKIGARMDNGEPEFHVKKLEKSGLPVDFITKIGGYHGFFKYDIKEVETINTFGCNAYEVVGNIETIWHGGNPEYHKTKIQFYKAEIDTTKRLIGEEGLLKDYDKLMSLL